MRFDLKIITLLATLALPAFGQGAGSSGGHLRGGYARSYTCAFNIFADMSSIRQRRQVRRLLMECQFTKLEANLLLDTFLNGRFDEQNFISCLEYQENASASQDLNVPGTGD